MQTNEVKAFAEALRARLKDKAGEFEGDVAVSIVVWVEDEESFGDIDKVGLVEDAGQLIEFIEGRVSDDSAKAEEVAVVLKHDDTDDTVVGSYIYGFAVEKSMTVDEDYVEVPEEDAGNADD